MRAFTSSPITALCRASRAVSQAQCLVSRRTFTSLPTLRPSLARPAGTVFRSSTPTVSLAPSGVTTASEEVADIVAKSAISSSPMFGATQIRCGPRATLARSSRLVRKRRHGFLSRVQTRTGRRTLQRRRTKGRHTLSN